MTISQSGQENKTLVRRRWVYEILKGLYFLNTDAFLNNVDEVHQAKSLY